jgi:hypothetical protein
MFVPYSKRPHVLNGGELRKIAYPEIKGNASFAHFIKDKDLPAVDTLLRHLSQNFTPELYLGGRAVSSYILENDNVYDAINLMAVTMDEKRSEELIEFLKSHGSAGLRLDEGRGIIAYGINPVDSEIIRLDITEPYLIMSIERFTFSPEVRKSRLNGLVSKLFSINRTPSDIELSILSKEQFDKLSK